jgi:hypothetical protein
MKLLRMVLVFAAAMLFATSLLAQCAHEPVQGSYSTTTSTMIGGRVSEAFCSGTPPGPGLPGNMQNAMSWNGAALGGQWVLSGMTIDAAGAVEKKRSIDAYGNGYIDYVTNYTGGQFWLSGAGAWGDGLGDFTGYLTYYNVGTRVSYIGGVQVGVTSNISFRGTFNECSYCFIDAGIANSILIWNGGGAMPSNYPPFLCAANTGELHDACCLTIHILCDVTSTEEGTWGSIKALYR